jgi:hypothetical protein
MNHEKELLAQLAAQIAAGVLAQLGDKLTADAVLKDHAKLAVRFAEAILDEVKGSPRSSSFGSGSQQPANG